MTKDNIKRSIITTLLIVFMSMFGAQTFAHNIAVANADNVTIYYNWINNKTELAVSYRGVNSSYYNNEYTGNVVIPESVDYNGNTYPVTSIGNSAFSGCSGLTSVTIPNSVTSIGNYAFAECSGLTSIAIPNSVISIGSSAFEYCMSLTSINVESGNQHYDSRNNCNAIIETASNTLIWGCKNTTIPNSVTSIGNSAFHNCGGLNSITIPNSVTSIGSHAFSGCSGLNSINVESGNQYYDSRNNCNAIIETASNTLIVGCKNTIIPNSVTSIGDYAFYYCSGLTSINIPNSVKSIGSFAFEYCRSLTSVTIPNSVTSIGSMAFDDCSGLTSVTIGNSVSSIGGLAFHYCIGLTSINVESGNQYYDSRNNCNAIIETTSNTLIVGCKNTTIPNNVTSIGRYAFAYCYGLTSVTIPNSVTSIGEDAFRDCWRLPSITIPNSVISIGSGAFTNCSSLTSITIPNSVTSIGSSAFYGCISLTSVTIPNSVTSIGNGAFTTCTALKSAIIGNGVTSIGSAFGHCINLQEMILSQAAYDNGIPESVTKFTTYSKNPMRVEVVSKGVVSATMKIYPIDEQGNTNENNYYTVTTSGQTPGQYIKWKLDDENYGIISEVTEGSLILETQPAQPMSTTKARLIATVNEADDDQHYGFEWLRYNAPDDMPPNKVLAPLYDGHIIGSLGGLNPDVYYKYRAFYKSDAGEMVFGEWVPFLTGDANVFFEPEVHTKDAIVTNDGALLSAVFIEGTEDIQEKGFEYWPMNSNARAVSLTRGDNIGSVIVSGNNSSVTIEGLEAGTEYGYRPYVKTASGTTYGEEKTFVTSMFGDVNGDNKVDHDDLNDLVSYIMGNPPEHFDKDAADLNNDKKVNAADIVKMVEILK